MNLSQALTAIFTGGDTDTEYANVTIYVFLYDSSSSYNKVIIINDAHVVTTTVE
jgi:hypothetical protein